MEKVHFESCANVSSDLVETCRHCDCADETDVKESTFRSAQPPPSPLSLAQGLFHRAVPVRWHAAAYKQNTYILELAGRLDWMWFTCQSAQSPLHLLYPPSLMLTQSPEPARSARNSKCIASESLAPEI